MDLRATFEAIQPYLLPLLFAVVIVAVLPLVAGYIVLVERKVMADMQVRLGPMRVGPHGLLQPIADALKLLIKEDIIPEAADKSIFWGAPLISVTAAMLALSALPIGPFFQIADLNIGLLFILGVSSLGIFGIVLGGWASNSHYSLLGALRSAAQLVSYETSAGMAVVGALLLAGTLSTRAIVRIAGTARHLVYFCGAGGIFHLSGGVDRGDQSRAVRHAGSGIRTGGRLHDRIQRIPLGALLPGRIHEHGRGRRRSPRRSFWADGCGRFRERHCFNFLDFFPPLMMLGIAGYCFYRAPKQPVRGAEDVHGGGGAAVRAGGADSAGAAAGAGG